MANKTALSLMAHPDDAEFCCAGTLTLLHQAGWDIHIASMTPGDCGTVEYSREEISRIRRAEAAKSAQLLGGTYHCLECDDAFIMYDRPTITKAIALMRKVRPAIVFTASRSDYMRDHEITAQLANTAAFTAGCPNIETPNLAAFETIPHFYYSDPPGAIDIYGDEIIPGLWTDIGSVIDTKEKMLACHESQRNWLKVHHGHDEYIDSMKALGEKRGKQIDCRYGEAFRQHLGEAFPTDNILKTILGDLVHQKQER